MLAMVVVVSAFFCHVTCIPEFRVVDLTHVMDVNTIFWPGNPAFNFTILSRGRTAGGYWYESNKFQTPEHGGTHLDAPAHFTEGTQRQQQIPIENLIGPGVVINVKDKAAADPDYRVSRDDLVAWETRYGEIPKGAVVMMNSGWSDKYPNKSLTFGTQSPAEPATFHFPGWHEDAVDWMVKNRNIHVLGVDTPSTDYGQSTTFPVHIILGNANVSGAENVANLDSLPEAGSVIYVAAIKLFDGSGGPARIFATISASGDGTNSGSIIVSSKVFILLIPTVISLFKHSG